MKNFVKELRSLLLLKQSLLVVETWEEERLDRILEQILKGWTRYTWSSSSGLRTGENQVAGNEDPEKAVQWLGTQQAPMIAVFHDADPHLNSDHPGFLRAVREFAKQKRGTDSLLLFTTPYLIIPDILKREMQKILLPLPDTSEIRPKVESFLAKISMEADPDFLDRAAAILRGLSEREIEFAMQHGRRELTSTSPEAVLDVLLAEKSALVKAGGVIEPIHVMAGVGQIGGLDNLKEWLRMRERFIRSYLKGESSILPRGVLLMGISGCGKSLSIKAIADIWKLPLFKLDMNLVFSGSYGAAERVFHEALRFMESVAPAVLWLDEIEMGLSSQANTGAAARIFAHFLTWMQEREELVFVAATANRIDLLPAELIRRGRFDQVFFVDLPGEEERKEIFQVHLKRQGLDIGKFDFITLSQATKNFSGAEIEQCVVSAYAAAISEGRELVQDDVYWEIHHIIPLATTMEEQVKSIRSWARKRAVNASKTA